MRGLTTKWICLYFLTIALHSCKSKYVAKQLDDNFYSNQFTGLIVYNPKTKDTVFKYNADKYFTPASNTKIFTLYTALQVLPEKIPAFKYRVDKDTLTIQGVGDPSFLHPFFNDSTALKMASHYKNVNIVLGNLTDDKFGPGWAWEDYDSYFSTEKSSFPMYGNVLTIHYQDSLQSIPKILKNNINVFPSYKKRELDANIFYVNHRRKDSLEIPMVIDSLLVRKLWDDLQPNKISVSKYAGKTLDKTAYSVSADSLYKRMMLVSDNFLAEQMLIMASSTLSDTLSSQRIRDTILNNQLKDLKHKPRWVDGSGLSRYNLFTPSSFVEVLSKLHQQIPEQRLFNFFPVGGVSGTLEDYFAGTSKPYIYAKSGTLGNNYSLSGYLITNSGDTLIFSFMNNHYKTRTSDVKKRMQTILEWLRDTY